MAWEKKQPDVVADAVIKRAEVGKVRYFQAQTLPLIGRILRTRLAFAQFKVARGWEDLSIDAIEPKVDEIHPILSDETFSKSSSPTISNTFHRNFRNPRIRDVAVFSEHIDPDSSSCQSWGLYRKRRYHCCLNDSEICSRNSLKRYRSSPPLASNIVYDEHHQPFSSPVKAQTNTHFTTASGPDLQFSTNSYQRNFQIYRSDFESEDDETRLPPFTLHLSSSPPCTPPSFRHRASFSQLKTEKNRDLNKNDVDLLLNLTESPPNIVSTQAPNLPSTSLHQNPALPSLIASTPRVGIETASGSRFCGSPNSPSQAFDFSDFVNITPSPVQLNWPMTPRTRSVKVSGMVDCRRLNFDMTTSSGIS
ncbi:hypothetical protein Golomagni_01741 [Golovinomyces magnicellulatus]|nr:hypothetical protein Golomagni_01741 [Golovinomyces magnicellulatus]